MFLNIAMEKVNMLIKREDFKEIAVIDDSDMTILFTNKCCVVDSFGRVTWYDRKRVNEIRN